MSAADVACYSAKESGRNRVQTYREGRAPERHREMQWVSRINRACEEDRLVLMCQPIVPIRARGRDGCGISNCCCACVTRTASWCSRPSSFPRPSAST